MTEEVAMGQFRQGQERSTTSGRKVHRKIRALIVIGIITAVLLAGWALGVRVYTALSQNNALSEPAPLTSLTNVYVNDKPTVVLVEGVEVSYGGSAAVYAGDTGWPDNRSIDLPVCWAGSLEKAVNHLDSYVLEGIDKSEGGGEFCDRLTVNPTGYAKLDADTS